MSSTIISLDPRPVWDYFSQLSAIPRASKKEEQATAFMLEFGQKLGLPTRRDACGNVIICKPAFSGREADPTVILQGHLDMVHQKNVGTDFDFDKEGIRLRLTGDWVDAQGTTLGADNGIGVAMIMAVLAATDLSHPPLEALFTIDEETGMTGAKELAAGELTGDVLLNLDTEKDTELCIGCAGGLDIIGEAHFYPVPAPREFLVYRVSVTGLTGGHSGMDIHLGRGNANKIINRVLVAIDRECSVAMASVDGGGLRNAIPREAHAVFGSPPEEITSLNRIFADQVEHLTAEYQATDPGLTITLEQLASDKLLEAWAPDFQGRFMRALQTIPNGIYRLSPDVEGLVQTSSNLARVKVGERKVHVACLCRGSVDSEKMDMAEAIRAGLELGGLDVRYEGEYPGWTPRPDAQIVSLMRETYIELFGHEPEVSACHAGLECGILGGPYPHMDMISFGPNILGAHSPDEKVQVSSVQKTWRLLLATLERYGR